MNESRSFRCLIQGMTDESVSKLRRIRLVLPLIVAIVVTLLFIACESPGIDQRMNREDDNARTCVILLSSKLRPTQKEIRYTDTQTRLAVSLLTELVVRELALSPLPQRA